MSGVDDRVVSMHFDNGTFEAKMAQTIASLDKLRGSLDFANSKRGLDELSTAGNNFNMGNMSATVEGVSGKFIAMSTIAITALATIVSHAVAAGLQIAKSLSIKPILDGFSDYELKIGATQTIMAGTGEDIDTVTGSLKELDIYADKTIYNLRDMVGNMSKFTNAGVELPLAVQSMIGIANAAALSGASSEEASRAMYNLGQAIGQGTVRLIDWKSVELANMGTVEFKQQLIDSAVAMGTLTKASDGTLTSLKGNEVNTKNFTTTLDDLWLTSEVLTTTLARYGDQTSEIGKKSWAAAQDVKSFSMMTETLKAAMGTGWTDTFDIVIGNLPESKVLWTNITNAIGGVIGASADARNDLLQGWKDLGGRTLLIQGFKDAFEGIGSILAPIKDAFREIFPKTTSDQLFAMTESFAKFAEKLQIGGQTADRIKSVFSGLFSILEIGWTVIKELVGFIGELIGKLSGAGGSIFGFAATTGDAITRLNDALVAGGGIHDFFEKLSDYAKRPIEAIKELVGNIVEFFGSFSLGEVAEARIDGITSKLALLAGIGAGIKAVFEKLWEYIGTWFSELGDKIAAAMKPGDFDSAVDVVNAGLLGGIVVMLKKFLTGGLKLDFGGGIFDKIRGSLDQLTGTLKAMQADLKAKALMKIAIAVGLLTASIVVLSLIDSAALTKALTGISVAFGQLIGAMALMDKLGVGAAKMAVTSAAMIAMAGSIVVLSLAIKILSGLSWEELAKGLIGVGVALVLLTTATKLIKDDPAGLISAGVAMIGISVALLILSQAVKAFSDMSWDEMIHGFAGIAVGLGLIILAMKLMPVGSTLAAGAAMIPLATGLTILAGAVKLFSIMSWADMAKGLVGIGAALVIIATAMGLMPLSLPLTAAGLVILSIALNGLAVAVLAMGSMKLGTLAKGIGALAIMLAVLAVAMHAMSGALLGAAALVVVSGALLMLTRVLKELGKLSIAEIATGLATIAAVLVVLAVGANVLAPLIPALLGLGIALGVVGVAFALFGVGAMLIAKAFETIAKVGKTAMGVIIESIKMLITALPTFVAAVALSLIEFANELLAAVPMLVRLIGALLSQILETIVDMVPQIALALSTIISEGIVLLQALFPELVDTGLMLLMMLLQGIRDNIGEIVNIGVDIVSEFAASLVSNMQSLVDAALSLVLGFLAALASRAGDIVGAGLQLLISLLLGITQNVTLIITAVAQIIMTVITELTGAAQRIITAGFELLVALLRGIADNINLVITSVTEIIATFIRALGESAGIIIQAGLQVLTDFLTGIINNIGNVITTVATVLTTFITGLGASAEAILAAGAKALADFLLGISANIGTVIEAAATLILAFATAISSNALEVMNAAADILVDFLNGLAAAIREKSGELREAGRNIASAILSGLTMGLSDKAAGAISGVVGVAKGMVGKFTGLLGANSPSKVFMRIGQDIINGLVLVFKRDTAAENNVSDLANRVVNGFQETLSKIPLKLSELGEFTPVITPVLDLTKVQVAARNLDKLMTLSAITPEVSYNRARLIATTAEVADTANDIPAYTGPAEITFEQNIYAPTALTTSDIYRSTRSQIALAKEELSIP